MLMFSVWPFSPAKMDLKLAKKAFPFFICIGCMVSIILASIRKWQRRAISSCHMAAIPLELFSSIVIFGYWVIQNWKRCFPFVVIFKANFRYVRQNRKYQAKEKSTLIRNYSVKAFRHSSALPTNTIYFSVRLLLFLFQQKREQNLRLCRKVFQLRIYSSCLTYYLPK